MKKDINLLSHREGLGEWLNENDLTGHGAEIGCAFGGYARTLLAKWKGTKLYMVDPWQQQDNEVYREKTNRDNPFEGWYREVLGLAARDPRVVVLRHFSVEGAKQVPDDSLDFAYIDGNHSYKAVLEDMDAWWPKVRKGGLLCGHDFYNEVTYPYFNEVEDAVKRWTSEHGVAYTVTKECSSWWIPKI
jgi:hypothetical protein